MRLTAKAVLLGLSAILGVRLLAMAVMPFADTSEPRYAEIARVMAAAGDWITPWFSPGTPFWGKPPLAFWAQAASGAWLGMSEISLRLPSWLAMLGMLAILHELGRRLVSVQAARWAVLVFSTMLLPFAAAGAVLTDPFLALGVILGMASFILAPLAPSWLWRYGLFIGLAIGFLAKGPLAAVLMAGAIVPWLLWHGNAARYVKALPWASGTALMAGLTLPWYGLAEWKTPGFLEYFIVGEHVLRFIDPGWTGDRYGSAHSRPYGGIWLDAVMATLPWGPVGVWLLLRRARVGMLPGRMRVFLQSSMATYLFAWGIVTPVFFTLSGNILWTYVLPSLPPIALGIGVGLSRLNGAAPRRIARACLMLVPTTAIVLSGTSIMQPDRFKTEKGLIARSDAERQAGERLYFVDSIPFSARFYSRGGAGVVSRDGLVAVLPGPGERVLLAVEKGDLADVRDLISGSVTPIYTSRRHVLLSVSAPEKR
ncbi:ArnT family glycosyltransferase [Achromobacter marplatensis]|uniref:ArnT family glycosyltransferase n=1 Tax=Achromobacter marplatensis TaxID=470868 RepID=UPI0039F67155